MSLSRPTVEHDVVSPVRQLFYNVTGVGTEILNVFGLRHAGPEPEPPADSDGHREKRLTNLGVPLELKMN